MKNHMDLYQQYIHMSRYSRWRDELGRRETWPETVQRYIDFFDNKTKGEHSDFLNNEIKPAIENLEIMPSMRALMSAGPALEKENICGFNCAFITINKPVKFSEALNILMCGTGVGFSCERQFVAELPVVGPFDACTLHGLPPEESFVIEDSRGGWVKAFRHLIDKSYMGEEVDFDFSKIRPAGAPLKTMGGRSSGPEPLKKLFKYTSELFKGAQGRKLSSIEVHDLMCMIAEIVVVGGVRRSALISLSNLSDQRMRDAKSGAWWETAPHRGLANNSVAYTEKPDAEIFMQEWLSLVKSKSGERGIFNRQAAQKQAAKFGRRPADIDYGTNPCCFTGDMRLLTPNGYVRFDKLVNNDVVEVVSSDGSVTKGEVWSSGIKETVAVKFHHSYERLPIKCTADHVFQLVDGSECQAKDLAGKRLKVFVDYETHDYSKEEILAGFMLGDGALNRLDSDDHLGIEVYFGEKDLDVAQLFNQGTGTWYSREARNIAEQFSLPAKKIGERGMPDRVGLLKGLYSANGSVITDQRISLKSIDKAQIEGVQALLKRLNIYSYITTNKAKKNKFANGEYECKESYDLNISKLESVVRFAEKIGFVQRYKMDALKNLIEKRSYLVRSIQALGEAEVFDFTEPKNHWGVVEGVVVHNSEIILRDRQFCNLTEVIVRSDDNYKTLLRKVKLATALGTFQATLTDFDEEFVSPEWAKNTAEEALLGVSLTGIMDNHFMSTISALTKGALSTLKASVVDCNREWAAKLGINPSAATTCVKPSGTVSQLCDTASGIHARHNSHYIRTVRVDKKDPLYSFMQDKGFVLEDDQMRPDSTAVASFPIKAPNDSVTRNDLSALHALKIWLMYQRHWCEHKPSVTITVRDEEWMEVGAWVYKHFDEVSGISFLPHSDHTYAQAPYQDLTEKEYNDWVASNPLPEIDWTDLADYEKEDNTVSSQTLACTGNNCELP